MTQPSEELTEKKDDLETPDQETFRVVRPPETSIRAETQNDSDVSKVHELVRGRLQGVYADSGDVVGVRFANDLSPVVMNEYANLAGEHMERFSGEPIPIIAAVRRGNPHGRYPFGGEIQKDEDLRVFRILNGAQVKPVRLSEQTCGIPPEMVRQLMKNPGAVNTLPLPFENIPTDAMTIAFFNDGRWEAQTVPYGEVSLNPWSTVLHYSGNIITGTVFYQKNGEVYGFRVDEHVRRASRDISSAGMPAAEEEFLMRVIGNQMAADSRWVPQMENPAGNRSYGRFTVFPNNRGPKLAGPNAAMFFTTTPIGMYKVDPMNGKLRVHLARESRPVPPNSETVKAGVNYPAAVSTHLPFAKEGYHETLFTRDRAEYAALGEFGDSIGVVHRIIVQEGTSSNIVAVYPRRGKNKRDLLLTPDPKKAGVLPGITAKSVLEIAQYLGMDVRQEELELRDLLDADEIGMCGTAMHGVVRVGEISDEKGTLFNAHRWRGDSRLLQIESIYDAITKGHGPQEFRHWMVRVT